MTTIIKIFGRNQIIANLKETTLKVFDNSDLESMYAWEYDIVTVPEENLDLVMSIINMDKSLKRTK